MVGIDVTAQEEDFDSIFEDDQDKDIEGKVSKHYSFIMSVLSLN